MDASGTDGKIVSRGEIAQLAKDAMDKVPQMMDESSAKVDEKAEEKPVKILFFEVSPSIMGFIQAGYNVLADLLGKFFAPKTGDIVYAALKGMHVQDAAAKQAGAVAMFGMDATLKSGDYVRQIFTSRKDQYHAKQKIAATLGSVLDEIKGNHSVASMLTVTPQQNEMIYAQCQRMLKQEKSANFGRYMDLVWNAGPNVLMGLPNVINYWTHGVARGNGSTPAPAAEGTSPAASTGHWGGEARTIIEQFVNATMPAIAKQMKQADEKKLQKTEQPYSALEMIIKLEEEISKNPGGSAFSAPNGGESFSLEDYVSHIITQHSKDMAGINPEYAEVRKALKPDVDAIAKPIAEAIKKGDLAPVTLIRWVGEGKILKDKGRKLASADEVNALLGKAEKAPPPPVVVNPKDYYMDAAFSQKELKAALAALKGDERLAFAAMFPDAILTQAGVKEDEIKAVHAYMLNGYENMLAHAVAGLAAQSDDELTRGGLGKEEIKQLREAAEALSNKGVAAIHEVKTTHANSNGIERTVTNWAVPRVRGGTHLGSLISKGREQLAAMAANPKPSESKGKTDEDDDKAEVKKTDDGKAEAKAPAPADPDEDKADDTASKADKSEDKAEGHVAALQQKSNGELSAETAR